MNMHRHASERRMGGVEKTDTVKQDGRVGPHKPLLGKNNITRTYIHTHTYMHTYVHTYIHTYTHTYIHTHIHTYKIFVTRMDSISHARPSGEVSVSYMGHTPLATAFVYPRQLDCK